MKIDLKTMNLKNNLKRYIMTRNTKKSLLAGLLGVFLIASLSACWNKRSEDSDVVEAAQNTARDYKVMGTWESSCRGSKLPHLEAQERHYYDFKADTFIDAYDFYLGSPDCKEPSLTLQYEGNFKIGNNNPESEDARDLDLAYRKRAIMTPQTDAGAERLNSFNFCGFSDWAKGVQKELSDRGGIVCDLLDRNLPETRLDLVKVVDDQLYFGDSTTLDTTKVRPTILKKDAPFKSSKRELKY